jgi:RNA polymerase sigma-70 factor (ECF subfamily)
MARTDGAQQHQDRLALWVKEHGPAVYGYVRTLVGDAHLAQDLAQETFVRAWQARGRFVESGKDRAYLLRIADRLAADCRRRRRRETTVDDRCWSQIEPNEPLSLDATMARLENAQLLERALASLSDRQRRTLLLRFFGDLSFAEIAEALDCPVSTVLSHCRRGLHALRRLLVEETL